MSALRRICHDDPKPDPRCRAWAETQWGMRVAPERRFQPRRAGRVRLPHARQPAREPLQEEREGQGGADAGEDACPFRGQVLLARAVRGDRHAACVDGAGSDGLDLGPMYGRTRQQPCTICAGRVASGPAAMRRPAMERRSRGAKAHSVSLACGTVDIGERHGRRSPRRLGSRHDAHEVSA